MKIAIVAAEFHREVASAMIDAATREAEHAGFDVEIARVHGSYEIPVPAMLLLSRRDVDAVVVLGFIERGETLHGEVMGHVVHRALVDVSLQLKKPIGVGIIGPGATLAQAHERKESYAVAAVKAAIQAYETARAIKKKKKRL